MNNLAAPHWRGNLRRLLGKIRYCGHALRRGWSEAPQVQDAWLRTQQFQAEARRIGQDPSQFFDRPYFESQNEAAQDFAWGRVPEKYRLALDLVGLGAEATILDYGCDTGEFVRLCHDMGIQARGVDVSAAAVALARERHPQCQFEMIAPGQVPPGPFDAVFLHHVWEHLPPEQSNGTLGRLSRSLQAGGALLVHSKVRGQTEHSVDNGPETQSPEYLNLGSQYDVGDALSRAGLVPTYMTVRDSLEMGYLGGLWAMARAQPKPLRSGPRVLIRYTARLGDQVALVPVIEAYRRLHPDVFLAVHCSTPDLYLNHPDVDRIYFCPPDPGHDQFDAEYTIPLPLEDEDRWLTLQQSYANRLGVQLSEPAPVGHLYFAPEEERAWRRRYLRPPGCQIVFAPYSGWRSKEWPMENWREVLQALQVEFSANLIFVGTPHDPYPGIGANLGGQTTPRELALLLRDADLCLSLDNGVTHLAATVGTPTLAIFGPLLGHLRQTAASVTIVQGSGCIGCYHRLLPTLPTHCPEGHHSCMVDITVGQVLTLAQCILRDTNGAFRTQMRGPDAN